MSSMKAEEANVLAVASHVVYGYVGNKMVTLVLQALGCEVSAINTVNYSNHTAYKQVKGTKTTAAEISELYEGLVQSNLNDFNLMLSGYMPNAEVVRAVGEIGKDLKRRAVEKSSPLFWALDPVMGDDARLYVAPDVVPAYKSLASHADLILPNKFEAELLSGVQIDSFESLYDAVAEIHKTYQIPHVIITSVRLDRQEKEESHNQSNSDSKTLCAEARDTKSSNKFDDNNANNNKVRNSLTVVGSTATSDMAPRAFCIDVPAFPLFFSGTGDMFAALTLYRFREQAMITKSTKDAKGTVGLAGNSSNSSSSSSGCSTAIGANAAPSVIDNPRWVSADAVADPTQLPLAKAVEKVLASMHAVLKDTAGYAVAVSKARQAVVTSSSSSSSSSIVKEQQQQQKQQQDMSEKERHLEVTKAAEIRVLRNIDVLKNPPDVEKFKSRQFSLQEGRAR